MAIDRRSFIKVTAGAAAVAVPGLAAALDPPPAGETPATGPRLTARVPGKLRLLVVTDLHFCASPGRQDARTSDHLRRMVDKFDPEAVIMTGDLWTENPDGDGIRFAEYAVGEMGKLGRPWAYARGNHDVVLPADDQRCRELLAAAPHSLYAGVNSRDCYRLEVVNPGGVKPFWNFYLLNNAYRKLLGFHPEQLAWFTNEAARVENLYGKLPAFAFFHIPLPEWQTIIDNGTARGVKFEKICLEEGSPGAFAALTAPGQVRAMFCGHDHTNNYHGTLDGVHLEYIRSTGQGTYGGLTVVKGGTVIELDATGPEPGFTTATVLPGGRKFVYQRRVIR